MNKISRHLSDIGVTVFVEGMLLPELLDDVPESIRIHVRDCEKCRERVFIQYDIDRKDDDYIEQLKIIRGLSEGITNQQQSDKRRIPPDELFIRPIIKLSPALYAVAASIAIIIGSAVFFIDFRKPDHEKLFSENFAPYPDIITSKSDVVGDELLSTALYQYNTENYEIAVMAFSEYTIKHPDDSLAQFYLGISYLGDNQAKKAVDYLKPLSEKINGTLRVTAEWYLGLAYLKAGNKKEARVVFETISESQSIYAEKAREIFKKLK